MISFKGLSGANWETLLGHKKAEAGEHYPIMVAAKEPAVISVKEFDD